MMVEPIIHWDPARLRQIGSVLAVVGVATLATKPLTDLGMSNRAALVVAGSLAVMAHYAYRTNYLFRESLSLLSAILAVVLPLLVCLHAFRVMVDT